MPEIRLRAVPGELFALLARQAKRVGQPISMWAQGLLGIAAFRHEREHESVPPDGTTTGLRRDADGTAAGLSRDNGGVGGGVVTGTEKPGKILIHPQRSQKRDPGKNGIETEFATWWARYPKRSGNNPRGKALQRYEALRRRGVTAEVLLAKLDEYRTWCESTGKIGTEFVKQARFWLSPAEEAWKATYQAPDVPLSASEQALERALWPDDDPEPAA